MLPPLEVLRRWLAETIQAKDRQGHVVEGLAGELARLPDSYDAFDAFARRLADLPLRDDWPYVEPNGWDEIVAEWDPTRPADPVRGIDLDDAASRAEAAFLASVCGCVLGKPLEVNPTLMEIRRAAEAVGEWPLNDYVSEALLETLGRRHASWRRTTRGRIRYVASDDDLNYTVLGMLLLEQHGLALRRDHIRRAWLAQLPPGWTFGPERFLLLKAGVHSLAKAGEVDYDRWGSTWNPKDEFCGALIRADALGYACPGRPALAAELAWRDAGWTHRRTGIYGEMFVAAAIALAAVLRDPMDIFHTALKFIPQRSRLHKDTSDALNDVAAARDWLDGYERIHRRYGKATHCCVYQEIGTLINTLRFAEDAGDGICKQVAQGNDTDSFGCTAGSILGAFFGPGHLGRRWLEPFQDEIRTALASFHERSLSRLARRMGELPRKIAAEIDAGPADRNRAAEPA
jgi:ADP-ribosylglycohydrolase